MIESIVRFFSRSLCCVLVLPVLLGVRAEAAGIVYDAEYTRLYAQHKKTWQAENKDINKKLADLKKKYGTPPNIIHIMWDDQGIGEVGHPLFNEIRGIETPHINQMANEGIMFVRMYTEPSCTASRAAVITGRHPIRSGMMNVTFPVDAAGIAGEEVTIAEVLGKQGYTTSFFGKWHLGDIEESYPHSQGYDETLFTFYNQYPVSFLNRESEEKAMTFGWTEAQWDKNYTVDREFRDYDYLFAAEATKGKKGREWARPSIDMYRKLHAELQKRSVDFIKKNAKSGKPFYMAYWPHLPFNFHSREGAKETSNGTLFGQDMEELDGMIGEILAELRQQGIAENTLVIAMADNGPAGHNPGFNQSFSLYRGFKGGFTEGAIRVSAFAWWPGMILPEQTPGDIIHETDLFTTFARLGGAMKRIPTDRVIDGIDQTSLLLNGKGHSRRDYLHVYTSSIYAATIKQQFKRHWIGAQPGLPGHEAYDLYKDPKEQHGMFGELLWSSPGMRRIKMEHKALMNKYPNRNIAQGEAFDGIERIK